ncbi:hypothetical protein AVEN_20357-1 [Araneus ventricosus]|uniref:Uncharacterized protein n=1 Tax=Araneus ventricosus TaxID=182803 RepID=A0A4Y2A4E1_ARAVE|nr:hypothetical protein AVEN_20357-1 [Araneus ventricosus]
MGYYQVRIHGGCLWNLVSNLKPSSLEERVTKTYFGGFSATTDGLLSGPYTRWMFDAARCSFCSVALATKTEWVTHTQWMFHACCLILLRFTAQDWIGYYQVRTTSADASIPRSFC